MNKLFIKFSSTIIQILMLETVLKKHEVVERLFPYLLDWLIYQYIPSTRP
ncbi:hypothetical protein GARC_1580 [Paraglaciecola arctica BSs20135]|uniref:Uncharacterized protein n=1 Tax=Paraglaciecola arctica BSs20135 TaxID=493475 RepID=K6YK37_9ALTE|nr:hypothetical protein GARC_1580 [Paraglaciecola arctica BSs20135]